MSVIKITQSRHKQSIEVRINNNLAAWLNDGESDFQIIDNGAAGLASIFTAFGEEPPKFASLVEKTRTILDAAEYTPDFARWVDSQQNWENKTVDDAGYLIDTRTKINATIERLDSVANESVMSYKCAGVFGVDEPVSATREYKARELRAIAQSLMAYADELSGPVIDESDSQKIGYDADHSIF